MSQVSPYVDSKANPKANDPDLKDADKLDIDADKLANGPVADRSCTDIICCCLFLAFLVGMGGTSVYGFMNGDPVLLLTAWDYDRNGCGLNETTKDFPLLYFPAPDVSAISSGEYDAFTYSTCVKSCPSNDTSTPVECKEPAFFVTESENFKNCQYYPYATTFLGVTTYGDPFRYNTVEVFDRYCLPSVEAITESETLQTFKEKFLNNYLSDKFTEYITDAIMVWYVEAISVGTAFILGMFFLLFLRCCAGVIIFFCLIAIFLVIGGGGAWLFLLGREKYIDVTDEANYKIWDATTYTVTNQQYFDIMTYTSYALWGLAGVYLIILLCLCGRIRLGVAIVKATARFINNTWSLFLIPIFFIIIIGAFICYWVFTAAYIFSIGQIGPRDAPLQFLSTVKWEDKTRYIFLYHLFGLLWVNAFIIGCAQFIIAAACCVWYFSHQGDTGGKGSISTGIKWIFRYHLGSIAFGSCIIAIVQFIRIIFEYYRKQIQRANRENPVIKALLCMTSYLLACLERCIKFITKNAYIQIALTSKNFCRSAWNAFCLVVRNILRFGVLHSIGCIFMFLGKAFIVVGNAALCYLALTVWEAPKNAVTAPYFPMLVCGIIGYIVGSIFMSIFSFSSDAILQCFFLDEELGNSGKRPPGNRPQELNAFVSKAAGGSGGCCGCCC